MPEAARWRLTNKHYIMVPEANGELIQWEYRETDRNTGRQARKVFNVPLYLNPEDPTCHNYPGEIIVADAPSREHPRDYIFKGDPTPDMEPLNDAAQAITDTHAKDWVHPIEGLASNYGEALLFSMQKQISEIQSKTGAPAVDIVSQLQKQVAELTKQVQTLTARKVA